MCGTKEIIKYSEHSEHENVVFVPYYYAEDIGIIFRDIGRHFLYAADGKGEYRRISGYFELYRSYNNKYYWLYLPTDDLYIRTRNIEPAVLVRYGIMIYDIATISRLLYSLIRFGRRYIETDKVCNNTYNIRCHYVWHTRDGASSLAQ